MELTQTRHEGATVAAVRGRVDHVSAEPFKAALAPLLDTCRAGADPLVLDLNALEYISSAGLRVLMLAARQVKAQGGRLAVCSLQPLVLEIFEISRFNLVFRVFPDVNAATAGLQ